MSFVYPPASRSVIAGNGSYRIIADAQNLLSSDNSRVSPADLIPVDVGFSAIAVGPESDYDRYALYYPDSLQPGGYQRMEFGVGHPLVGLFPVDPTGTGPAGNDGEPAKAFIQPIGVPQINFVSGQTDVIQTITDVVVYTGDTPTIIPDKRVTSSFSAYVPILVGVNLFVIPCFGRRHLNFHGVANSIGGATVTTLIRGLRNYTPKQTPNITDASAFKGGKITWTTELQATTPLSFKDNSFGYDCVTGGKGFFHYFEVRITSDTEFLVSDGGSNLSPAIHVNLEVRDI